MCFPNDRLGTGSYEATPPIRSALYKILRSPAFLSLMPLYYLEHISTQSLFLLLQHLYRGSP